MQGVCGLAETMWQLVQRAGEQTEAVSFMFGEVVSCQPLLVQVEQRLLLPQSVLVLTDAVIAKAVLRDAENWQPGDEKVYDVVHNLAEGDRVLLAKMQGGQQFVILSKCYAVEALNE